MNTKVEGTRDQKLSFEIGKYGFGYRYGVEGQFWLSLSGVYPKDNYDLQPRLYIDPLGIYSGTDAIAIFEDCRKNPKMQEYPTACVAPLPLGFMRAGDDDLLQSRKKRYNGYRIVPSSEGFPPVIIFVGSQRELRELQAAYGLVPRDE